MQSVLYLSVAFFSWIEYVEVDSTTEWSALSLKAQNRQQNEDRRASELFFFFFIFSKLPAAYFENNLLANRKNVLFPAQQQVMLS